MSKIVKTIACIVSVPIIVFGLYVISHGHLTPGGGFAGGAIIATFVALLAKAFDKEITDKGLCEQLFSFLESVGLLMFIILGFFGLPSTFFYNFLANSGKIFGRTILFGSNPGYINSGGVIPLMNLAVGLEVFAALSLIILLMSKKTSGEVKPRHYSKDD